MNNLFKQFYAIGNFSTFKTSFVEDTTKVEEYIHCIVLEHLELDRKGNPEIIKVSQIFNLQEYSKNKENAKTFERVLKVSELEVVINIFSI